MTEGQDRQRMMRDFLVLWRLRAGPMTNEGLVEALGLEAGGEEAGTLSDVVAALIERSLVIEKDGGGSWELTPAGRELVDGASESVATSFVDMCQKEQEEGK